MIFTKANIVSLSSYASHFTKAKLTPFAISFGLKKDISHLPGHLTFIDIRFEKSILF